MNAPISVGFGLSPYFFFNFATIFGASFLSIPNLVRLNSNVSQICGGATITNAKKKTIFQIKVQTFHVYLYLVYLQTNRHRYK